MRRRKIKWNPDDEPLKAVFVREPASLHDRYKAAAAAAEISLTAWSREALRSALETAEDQARYLEILKNDRERQIEIEIEIHEDDIEENPQPAHSSAAF